MRRVILFTALLVLTILGLAPIAVMFARSLSVDGAFSFENYRQLLTAGRSWQLLGNSIRLALTTASISTLVGLPLGLVFAKTNLPLRRAFVLLFTLPLVIPPYIWAVSWADVLRPHGLASSFIAEATLRKLSGLLFSLPGCVLVLTTVFMPAVMLATMTFVRTINPRMEEAARLSARPLRVLSGVTIPLIWPAVLLAATLVFLLSLGEFGVPIFLRYQVFAVESFTQFTVSYNFAAATASAAPLALLTFIVLGIEWFGLREKIQGLRPAEASGDTYIVPLRSYRVALFSLVSVLCAIFVIVPLLSLLVQAGSWQTCVRAFQVVLDSLMRSIFFAALGATALTVLGFFVGYVIHTRALSIWRAVDGGTVLLFALPGTVIGMGLIALWNRPATNLIYATPLIILFGYLAQYTALTGRVTVAGLSLLPASMEEAAANAGASWTRRVGLIVLPLMKYPLASGWLIAYIFCLRDTGITMLVYPPGYDTLPVRIFTLMANGAPPLIAAACVLMIAATVVPLLGIASLMRIHTRHSWH
ncbi:MAG TPA: iron ABC transporter permease [Pyrinomonadaceae bacterium]|nr:iron ABC transporter permease [Pyrinomonadaceae bacterium]